MFKQTLIAAASLVLVAAATTTAFAQTPAPPPDKAGAPRMYGYELMTPEERQAYADKMRAAKTPEERTKLRDEHRAEMQKRAKEKGVTLQEPQRRGAPKGGRQSQMSNLFTEQERAEFHQRMKDAKTPEERDKVRADMRAQTEARAKEKGVTLPPERGPGGPGAKGGPGGGRGQMYGEQLFSQQERDDYRKRMQEAKTPDERAKIRDEVRTQADARAKEKGITLPEPRGPRGPGPGPGTAPGPGAPKAQ